MPSQVCSNEGKCICRAEWTGKDCSVYDPIPEPKPTGETERYKGPCAPWGGGGDGTGRALRAPAVPGPHGLGHPALSPVIPWESSVTTTPPPPRCCGPAGHSWVLSPPPGPHSAGAALGLCPHVMCVPPTPTDVCPCSLFPFPSVTGPSGTNIIIGSIAGAVLVAAIVLGGTGWGFK